MKNDLNNFAVVDYTIQKYTKYCSNFTFELQKNRKYIHPPGFHDCFLKRDNKTIFMHIDKCASSSVSIALKKSGLIDMSHRFRNINLSKNYFLKNNYKFYSIIRNPKDRYISGLQEFIKIYNPPLEYIEYNLKNNKFIFDEHTSPQNCFLFLCDDKCNYLKLDNNISKKISKVIGIDITLQKENVSIEKIKDLAKNIFKEYCDNNREFYNLYKEDYKIYTDLL